MSLDRSAQNFVDPKQQLIELQNTASIEFQERLLTGKCEVYFGQYGTYINFPICYGPSEFSEQILKNYGADYEIFNEYQEGEHIVSTCLYIHMGSTELFHILNITKNNRTVRREDNLGFDKPIKSSNTEDLKNDLNDHRVRYKIRYFDELIESEHTALCNEIASLAKKLLNITCKIRTVRNFTYIDFPLNTDEEFLEQITENLRKITKPFRPTYSEDKEVIIYCKNNRTMGQILLGPAVEMNLELQKLFDCLKKNLEANLSDSTAMDTTPSPDCHFTALLDRSENNPPVYTSEETKISDSFPQTEKLLAYQLKVERLVANYDTSDFGSLVLANALKNNKFTKDTQLLLPYSNLHHDSLIGFSIALITGNCPDNLTIDLHGNFINDRSLQIFARALESEFCPNYLTLNLTKNQIGKDGAIALANALKSNKCPFGLTVNLNDNAIAAEGFEALLEAMKTDNYVMNNTHISMTYGWGEPGKKTKQLYEAAVDKVNERRQQINQAAFACLCLYNSKKDEASPFYAIPLEIIYLISFFAFPFKDADKQALSFARNIQVSITQGLTLRFGFFHQVSAKQPKKGVVIATDIDMYTCWKGLPQILQEKKPVTPEAIVNENENDDGSENDEPCYTM